MDFGLCYLNGFSASFKWTKTWSFCREKGPEARRPFIPSIICPIHGIYFETAQESNPRFHYHPHCKQLGLTHLMFADDLVIFSKADPTSLHLIMEAL